MTDEDESHSPRWKRRITIGLAILCVVGLGLGAWGFLVEPGTLRTQDHNLSLESWPSECAGLRVAVLADLHVGSPHNGLPNLAHVVDTTQAALPDLILLAGDFVIQGVVGGSFVSPEETAKELSRLSAPAGVFAVLGNHDWWLDPKRVRKAFEAVGIPVLEDASRRIELQDCSFWLAGVSDYWVGPHDVKKALHGVPTRAPSIVFTHNPDVFPEIPRHVSLTVAGHTHGGQVYIPGLGRPVVPSGHGERFAIGHVVENGRHLFVSSGVGTSILPVRFLVPPEISIITLGAGSE